MNKLAMVFNGPPGCGKGSIIKHLSKMNVPLSVLSMSDELSKLRDSPMCGVAVREAMDSGRLVPDSITLPAFFRMWSEFGAIKGPTHFALDGVARTEFQAQEIAWKLKLTQGRIPIQIVVNVPLEECRRRLLLRKRGDDQLEVILKRFEVFEKKTLPAIERFASELPGNTVYVSGDRDPSITAAELKHILAERFDLWTPDAEDLQHVAKKLGFTD